MATYQFVLELIPKTWAENKSKNEEMLFDDEFYDLTEAWKNHRLIIDTDLFSQILPKGTSWRESLQIWGDEEKSDIQLSINENNIESIKIRLNLRDNVEDLKLKVLALANRLGCYLFSPQLRKIIPPDIASLNIAISSSSAARFVVDPVKFLNEKN